MYPEPPERRGQPSAPTPASDRVRPVGEPNTGCYTLLGPDGHPYQDNVKGILGGHRRDRIYGRLNCRAATQAIVTGGYTPFRVFFASESDAISAGYRPCAVCLPYTYAYWQRGRQATT